MKEFPASARRLHLCPEKDAGLNGFKDMVCVRFAQADPALSDHVHPDALELCYITKGSQVYAVGGRRWQVSAGMAYVTYPNELHSSDEMKQEKDVQLYFMIIDTLNDTDHFLGLSGEEGRMLARQLNGMNRCFYVGMELQKRLDEMFRLLTDKPEGYELLLRCHACLMIHELVSASRSNQPSLTRDICGALQFIEDALVGPPPDISEIAEQVHLSVPRFKQKFRQQVGLPPIAYQTRRRIEKSCEMLKEGMSITQIAYDLGFSSSQHFSTIFRRYMGMSPREWKKG